MPKARIKGKLPIEIAVERQFPKSWRFSLRFYADWTCYA